MFSELDTQMMQTALSLACQGLYSTSPNPRVGCVILDAAGMVIGEGWHRACQSNRKYGQFQTTLHDGSPLGLIVLPT